MFSRRRQAYPELAPKGLAEGATYPAIRYTQYEYRACQRLVIAFTPAPVTPCELKICTSEHYHFKVLA